MELSSTPVLAGPPAASSGAAGAKPSQSGDFASLLLSAPEPSSSDNSLPQAQRGVSPAPAASKDEGCGPAPGKPGKTARAPKGLQADAQDTAGAQNAVNPFVLPISMIAVPAPLLGLDGSASRAPVSSANAPGLEIALSVPPIQRFANFAQPAVATNVSEVAKKIVAVVTNAGMAEKASDQSSLAASPDVALPDAKGKEADVSVPDGLTKDVKAKQAIAGNADFKIPDSLNAEEKKPQTGNTAQDGKVAVKPEPKAVAAEAQISPTSTEPQAAKPAMLPFAADAAALPVSPGAQIVDVRASIGAADSRPGVSATRPDKGTSPRIQSDVAKSAAPTVADLPSKDIAALAHAKPEGAAQEESASHGDEKKQVVEANISQVHTSASHDAPNAPAVTHPSATVEPKSDSSARTASLPNDSNPDTRTLNPADHNVPEAVLLHSSRLMQDVAQAEMRLDMRMGDLGNVEIRTLLHHQQLHAEISVERGELGHAISAELPALQQRLHDQQVPLESLILRQQASGGSGGFQGNPHQQQPAAVPADSSTLAASVEKHTASEEVIPAAGALDVHI